MSDTGNQSSELVIEGNVPEGLNTHQLNDAWISQASRATTVPLKKQVSLRIDEDILDFFKQKGNRYQTKMHTVLRAYVDAYKIANKKNGID